MKKKTILILVLPLFFACERAWIDENNSSAARENFNELWKQADENYAFFDYKNVDWNSVYNIYSSQVSDGMSEEDLFDVVDLINNMLHHFCLHKSRCWVAVPVPPYRSRSSNRSPPAAPCGNGPAIGWRWVWW